MTGMQGSRMVGFVVLRVEELSYGGDLVVSDTNLSSKRMNLSIGESCE